ncbi:unnamed protein product [Rhodiola kirilowii]
MDQSRSEIIRFIQTWLIVYFSLTYSFLIAKLVSPGKIRFLLISPVVCLFLLLPLRLTSVHLGGTTAFFISWLATFKLILFSFNKGPLSSDPNISLLRFIATGSLPIKINPKSKLDATPRGRPAPDRDPGSQIWKPAMRYAVKAMLLAVLFKLYDFKARLHPTAILFLYCFHIYFVLEFILAVVGAAARAGLGLELEPQFNEPYLATSLKDFWGKRWNLVVTSILRPTVYEPTMNIITGPTCQLSRNQAEPIAVLATFGVSAIMHELMIYNLGRLHPTGKMSSFFLLHGLCVVSETAVLRRLKGKWRVPRVVSSSYTILIVMSTAIWLFFPDFLRARADVKSFQEYAALGQFIESVTNGSIFRSFNGIVSVQHFFQQLLSY